jgi:polyphosphate kinase 2
VKLQRHVIKDGRKVLVILEGRDAAGKDGTIKRITEHLSPRETRVVALGKPSDRETSQWYFQRWVQHLPAAHEMVLFNRSWYNRAGVERVMGFCTPQELQAFFTAVPQFEQLLLDSGIQMLKYYLDISRAEQKRRLSARRHDPLKQWKISPVDKQALKHWHDYSVARDDMLLNTHSDAAPWTIVKADSKALARLNLIRHLLQRLPYRGREESLCQPDPRVVADFDPHRDGALLA